ncbi:two-component regulator propeller domain-containing protein [bacterium]
MLRSRKKLNFNWHNIASTICLAAILSSNGLALQRKMQFRHLTVDDGLSHLYVRCIMQDDQGFMWFGTFDGLNRYDGYQYKVYRYLDKDSTSIPSNIIRTLFKDSNGNLWVGTIDGLCRYDRSQDAFIRFLSDYHYSIESIGEDNDGKFWFGTGEAGLFILNPVSNTYTQFTHQEGDTTGISGNYV